MSLVAQNYLLYLDSKYNKKINVNWVWAVVILISVIGAIGYAFYCTRQGGTFAGGIKIGVPNLLNVTFKCKK